MTTLKSILTVWRYTTLALALWIGAVGFIGGTVAALNFAVCTATAKECDPWPLLIKLAN